MIKRICTIARFTVLEELRNRLLGATVLFGALLAYFGLVLARLAAGFEGRFFRDTSFALLEFFALALALQSAYRIIQQDMKKGSSVEMFFVRPIRRWEYLLGRAVGVCVVMAIGLIPLVVVAAALAVLRGFELHAFYAVAAVEIYLKMVVMLSAAFFLAAITTSQASYFVSAMLVYLSGNVTHLFSVLVRMQAEEGAAWTAWLIKPLIYLLPNFSLFGTINALDAIQAGVVAFEPRHFAAALIYTGVYSACAWALSAWIFSKRELLP